MPYDSLPMNDISMNDIIARVVGGGGRDGRAARGVAPSVAIANGSKRV